MTALVPRLASILGMLGSAHDGEALAAARAAERLRAAAGVPWMALLVSPPAKPESPDWRTMVAACKARPDALTPWEADFLAKLAAYTDRPSARQLGVLDGIHRRVWG